jgi:flagellar motor switch protein FliG
MDRQSDPECMMTHPDTSLRKAAVLIRSLDSDTAATMLRQLSPEEMAKLRDAIRALGSIDPEEQADVAAEFRSARPIAAEPVNAGVELSITSAAASTGAPASSPPGALPGKRFEFLESAPIDALVPYLAREHVQTIAVVLAQLPPPRAAGILAALPDKTQAETLERLSAMGESDPESVIVVERELAAWLARRNTGRPGDARRNGAVASILAAADATARDRIIASLRVHKAKLAKELAPIAAAQKPTTTVHAIKLGRDLPVVAARSAYRPSVAAARDSVPNDPQVNIRRHAARHPAPTPPPPVRLQFDDLIHLDNRTLAAVLREVSLQLLVLALAGSKEELVRRIYEQMPKRTTRLLRRELRRLGPTRLNDVEAAQHAIALLAAQRINDVGSRNSSPSERLGARHREPSLAARPQVPISVA